MADPTCPPSSTGQNIDPFKHDSNVFVPQPSPGGYPPQPNNGYPPQPGTGYPPQPSTSYPPQPGTSYPPQPSSGYPPQPNNGYPPQPGTGYPPQPGTGYPPQPGTGYHPQPGTGYPPQPGTGYPPQPGTGYPPQPGTGYPLQPGTGYPPQSGTGYSPQPGPGYPMIDIDTAAYPPPLVGQPQTLELKSNEYRSSGEDGQQSQKEVATISEKNTDSIPSNPIPLPQQQAKTEPTEIVQPKKVVPLKTKERQGLLVEPSVAAKEISKVSSKWKTLGENLSLNTSDLSTVRAQSQGNNQDALLGVLKKARKKNPNLDYSDLMTAVFNTDKKLYDEFMI